MKLVLAAMSVLLAGVASGQGSSPAGGSAQEELSNTWPRAIDVQGGSLEIFQPQIESFKGIDLASRSAVAWTPTGKAPVFGVVWMDARVAIDRDSREVTVETVSVRRVRFPNLSDEQAAQAKALLEREIPTWDMRFPLDDILASLAVKEQDLKASDRLGSTPPRMIFSQEPAVLLLYDGAPIEHAVESAGLKRVVNTPMLVLFDPVTRRYYLSGGAFWYEAPAATGPFAPVAAPSKAVNDFFARNPPPPAEYEGTAEEQAEDKALQEPTSPPRIFVATEPSELVVFDGAPQYRPLGSKGDLLYVENTQSRVLVHVPTSETYVVVTGRWFKASSLDGPWKNVRPDRLPKAFQSIPPDSDVGDVRTFVPGTEEAQDAVADTEIPQTAEVRRDLKFEATYDGEPQFQRIEGTHLAYAVNTPDSIIQDAGKYWACDQAVWYDAPTPKGPWAVSETRPPHIEEVPPTVHVYNTKYVFVYRSTPQVVFVGFTPGYVSMFRHRGVVVFGTGFHFRPWVSPVVFFPRPATFGFRMVFNPWVGWVVVMGPSTRFVTVGIHFGPPFGPRRAWWGPVGFRPFPPPIRGGWHRPPPGVRTSFPGHRPPSPNFRPPPPGARPPSARPPSVQGGGRPGAAPQRPVNNLYAQGQNRARNVDRVAAAPQRPAPMPVDRPNNVFADRSGNVYRQNDRGNWDRNTAQGWQPQSTPQRPAPSQPGNVARPSPSPSPSPGPGAGQRPSAPGPGARPAPPSGGQNRAAPAPAGLGGDAAARQRSAPPPARPGGAGGARR